MKSITVYTDGSCNHAHRTGGWAAILFIGNQKLVLKGKEQDTTHQRMELTAVLKMLDYVEHNHLLTRPIQVYTDSQYVVNLQKRRANLVGKSFLTKRSLAVANVDLVREFFTAIDKVTIEFTKVHAHKRVPSGENLNRDVDKLARAEVREYLRTVR